MRHKKTLAFITTLILCMMTIVVFAMYKPFVEENSVLVDNSTYLTEDFSTQSHNPLPAQNKVKKQLLLEEKETDYSIAGVQEEEESEESREEIKIEDEKESAEAAEKKEEQIEKQKEIAEQVSQVEEQTVPAPPAMDRNLSQHLNPYVLEAIKGYNMGGGRYPYLLNNDYANYNGVTTTLHYQDQVLLKAHPSGNRASHCSGITFEVFFKAMQARNRQLGISPDHFNGMTWDELYDFVLTWYAAQGPKHQNNIAVAVEKYGIGQRIRNLEEAAAGDFIDISRENNTGHTAVFLEWIREGNQIIGLKYWSSQDSTRGIQYNQEYFNVRSPGGKKHGNVMIDRVYIARILPVNQYKPFK
ncbi:hypothetical protein CACET_c37680 [Clostridium aceticum]|uniref:Uncharacterized protein n=1 Tax=Clostridium aceticum TaxID=84022 RepID=A0A0D8I7G3_9CLOT|nr:hypothetical protein [Clostridium aceticum]AKL97196.1 hypothetical protein CACET_c37680 [Clostridium aceticum]KJF26230.1 hypothetical protein TZ02_13680 [Clostridium aceticum]